jgi:hypothetical protein
VTLVPGDLLLWRLHQTEILAVWEGDEFLGQDQDPYLHAVQKLLFGQVSGVSIHPIDKILYLVHKC